MGEVESAAITLRAGDLDRWGLEVEHAEQMANGGGREPRGCAGLEPKHEPRPTSITSRQCERSPDE